MAELNKLVGHITSNNLPINVQIVGSGPQGIQGKPGRTPEILAIQEEDGITITVDGKAIATIKDGKDGYSPVKNKDYFDGVDGISPVATVSKDGDTVTIIITDKGGTTTAIVKDGKDGSVSFDDLTPEQKAELKGEPGYTPVKGVDYFDGKPGYTPVKGVDYFDGYTPQRGVDYFTEAEVEAVEDGAAAKVVVPVQDVQVNGASVVHNGIAEIPAPNIPSKTSELENDSGFITSTAVPTKVSELENDSSYATTTQVNAKAPNYTYSTTDLTAGSSSLTTGVLYFVYQ